MFFWWETSIFHQCCGCTMRWVHAKKLSMLNQDELKIFCRVEDTQDCLIIQQELEHLNKFCNENSLFLNLSKCHVITFTHNKTTINYPYCIEDTQLSRVNVIRDLDINTSKKSREHLPISLKYEFDASNL
ncbi:hypothetical protein HHI36_011274 [Cryptolaemus montrouzieri]|uniref:Uncharacterized protein n=1 Tax=Cryptolaemus montrouzieri TaxID=559131 RepID=A0ABD2MLD8_9CUCU